jgi:hypothetical protein
MEFIGRCHINADIGIIPTKSGPDFASTLAEGDGRDPIFPQQEIRFSERAVDYVNWESGSIERMPAFPEGTFHRHNVIQEDGDQVILVSWPVRPASFGDFAITWQGCIECRSPSMIKTHGMDGYALAILFHIHPHLSRAALLTFNFLKFCQDLFLTYCFLCDLFGETKRSLRAWRISLISSASAD